jgi:hypothetical protein
LSVLSNRKVVVINFVACARFLVRSCHFRAQECPGPLPPTDPRNPFAPMKSIIHGARRIIGQ